MTHLKGSQVVEVIQSITLEGEGVAGDPCRDVLWYHSKDGQLLAVTDPCGQMTLKSGVVYKSKCSDKALG
jgi:hypothetical protein